MNDGESFLTRLEQSQEDGDTEHVEGQIDRLEFLIAKYQDRIYELADLQYRARLIRDRYEPSAAKRIAGG